MDRARTPREHSGSRGVRAQVLEHIPVRLLPQFAALGISIRHRCNQCFRNPPMTLFVQPRVMKIICECLMVEAID